MKSTELMIGDWVRLQSVDYANGVIRYVEENKRVTVDHLSRLEKQESKIVRDDNIYAIHIEPIELTTEILQKNGFETNGGSIRAAYCSEDKHAYLEISEHYHYSEIKTEGGFYWTINCGEYDILRLRYVHELQHALNLCGINKTVEL